MQFSRLALVSFMLDTWSVLVTGPVLATGTCAVSNIGFRVIYA